MSTKRNIFFSILVLFLSLAFNFVNAASNNVTGLNASTTTTPFQVTIKVIDRTVGAYTNNVPTAVQDSSVFTWIGTNDANWNWLSTLSNTGNWYTNMFDGFTGGKLEKNVDEWVWSYTFTATAGNYSWNPYLSTGTAGVGNPLAGTFGLKDQSVANNNIRFTVSSTGEVTGQTSFIIFNNTSATITTADGEGTALPNVNTGYLQCSGKYIVDGNGNEVILKGMGLGNYMELEPYMMGVNNPVTGKSDTQHAMINSLGTIAGATVVDNFLDAYRANYLAKIDVDSLKSWGINSIRLPMHYNLLIQDAIGNDAFIEKGFSMIDSLLSWCEANGMHLILDMHIVPGGQGNDISTSDHNTPALWVGDANGTATQYQDKLVVLWKEVARRYAGSTSIAGYDLINETNYYGSVMPASLVNEMKRITTAIRQVDQNHIIFVEGNGFANDFTGLTPTWDNNMAYSFHRYWIGNATSDIQWMLDIRNNNNVPLWMGESGENSNEWFTEAVELLQNNKIGWSWWSYKKVSSISAFGSIPSPANWDKVISYLESPTDNSASIGLTASVLTTALNNLAENAKLQNCKIFKDMIYSMMTQPNNNNTKPYSSNLVPGKIYASEYDMGRNLYAYSNTVWANYGTGSTLPGNSSNYNPGWAGRNDGVGVQTTTDVGSNGFNVGYTVQGEWLKYTVNAQVAGQYQIQARYAVSGTGNVTIKVNGVDALANVSMGNTNAWTTYQTNTLGNVNLNAGQNEIIVYFNAGINLSYLQFTTNTIPATVTLSNLTATYDGTAKTVTATTTPSGLTTSITYNGITTAPTAVGTYPIVATVTSAGYQGSATGTLTISKATATVSLSGLTPIYSGTAKTVTATTIPTGLTVGITYNGSTTAPTAVGTYPIVATINDANYQGSTTGSLVISKATATVSLSGLTPTYSGTAKTVSATTTPTGLTTTITYNGSTTAPTAVGTYPIVATISDANYQGSVTGSLVISKATATISLNGLATTYDGTAKTVTATTTPSGLIVNITYNGSTTAPSAIGTYPIVATISDSNYQGSITGSLVISDKPTATITLSGLTPTYDGTAKAVTATTSPSGLNVTITYNGSATVPTVAGTYQVVATVNDNSYQGTTTGSLVIAKATASNITLSGLTATYDGTAKTVTATTTPSGLTVAITYNGIDTAPINAGTYPVIATINDANYQGSATGNLVISKATATVSLSGLTATYDGTTKTVIATTTPNGLTVNITYNGSTTAPTAVGTYPIVATIDDPNYQGSTTGSLVISGATGTINTETSSVDIISYNDIIKVSGVKIGDVISVYTLNGTLLFNIKATQEIEYIYSLKDGVYVVSIPAENIDRKVLVH